MHRGLGVFAQRLCAAPAMRRHRLQAFQPSSVSCAFSHLSDASTSPTSSGGGSAVIAKHPETLSSAAAPAATARTTTGGNTVKDEASATDSAQQQTDSSAGATSNSNDNSSCATTGSSQGSSSLSDQKEKGLGSQDGESSNTSNTSNTGRESPTDEEGGPWWHIKWTWTRGLAAVSAASFGCWFAYEFAECGYSLGKAEWVMSHKIKKLFLGEPEQPRALADSKFQTGLSEDIQNELALYFIQLDLDKPNGVRRTDALALAEMLGFDVKNKICGSFVQRGKGRPIEERRASGCSLQEAGELIEALVLHEEANGGETSIQNTHQQQQSNEGQAQEDQQQKEKDQNADSSNETAPESTGSSASSSLALPGEKTQERVLRLLREANGRATPTAWAIPQIQSLQQPLSTAQQQQPHEANQSSDVQNAEASREEAMEALELRMAVITRTLNDLQALGARRGHSEAEKRRREDLEAERKMAEKQLRDLKYA